MAKASCLAGTQALFGACLLHHQLDKLLKRQRRSIEPFERNGFEQLRPLDDVPRARLGRQVQGHALASQGLPHRVVFQIDAHAAMAVDRPHHMQAITDLQPAIRIDDVRHRWQLRQAGKNGARRTIATTEPLMRTLKVVVLLELCSHSSHLLQGRRTLPCQAFFLLAAMRTLHKAVLLRLVWVADMDGHAQAVTEARPLPTDNRCLADC